MQYSHEATAKRAHGQPLILTALGRFKSAPVVENMEVAAATGGRGGQRDDDVSGRATMMGAVAQTASERHRVGGRSNDLDSMSLLDAEDGVKF